MKVIIIGGTGHIGTYLVPRLVEAGHQVTVVSRGQQKPYSPHAAWKSVRMVVLDRDQEEKAGTFGRSILAFSPDVVIDMICFTEESNRTLVEALRGKVQRFLHCGTAWVHGKTIQVPVTEEEPRFPIGDYGTQKAAIEAYLWSESRQGGLPSCCILPGHIVGPGWEPVNPLGNFNPEVFARLAHGDEVILPNQGTEVVHHVHADDVAQLFMKALVHWNQAAGESFNVVSPAALTLRGYAEAMAAWFGKPARLRYLPWEEWRKTVSPEDAEGTWGHLEHSPNCYSIAKAQRLLDYRPRYTSLEAIYESVDWLVKHGVVKI